MDIALAVKQLLQEGKITPEQHRNFIVEHTIDILERDYNFEILESLGEGAYGKVISAMSPSYEDEVAIKMIVPEASWEGEFIAWPTLDHKNILPLLDIISLEHLDLFVTPMMAKDLDSALKEQEFLSDPSAFCTAKRWLDDVLGALDYLHRTGYCHLDLKANNILIDFDSNALLCDFSFINTIAKPVIRYGVPYPYTPPELCSSRRRNVYVDGGKFDMWTYGMLAFNVLTRHHVHKAKLDPNSKNWKKDVFPVLQQALQISSFQKLMSKAFPASDITEVDCERALNFVLATMKFEQIHRPSAEEAMRHVFLGRGDYYLLEQDEFWNTKGSANCIISSADSQSDIGAVSGEEAVTEFEDSVAIRAASKIDLAETTACEVAQSINYQEPFIVIQEKSVCTIKQTTVKDVLKRSPTAVCFKTTPTTRKLTVTEIDHRSFPEIHQRAEYNARLESTIDFYDEPLNKINPVPSVDITEHLKVSSVHSDGVYFNEKIPVHLCDTQEHTNEIDKYNSIDKDQDRVSSNDDCDCLSLENVSGSVADNVTENLFDGGKARQKGLCKRVRKWFRNVCIALFTCGCKNIHEN